MLISVDCALLLALVVLTPGNDRTAGLTRAIGKFKPIAIAGVISYSVYRGGRARSSLPRTSTTSSRPAATLLSPPICLSSQP